MEKSVRKIARQAEPLEDSRALASGKAKVGCTRKLSSVKPIREASILWRKKKLLKELQVERWTVSLNPQFGFIYYVFRVVKNKYTIGIHSFGYSVV